MKASHALRAARRRAGLTQQALADRTGVPKSTVARIEIGAVDPRTTTLDRLLIACGESLTARPRLAAGVDRSGIRENLQLTHLDRLQRAVAASRGLARLRDAAGLRG